ncbi:formin isoform X1 [Tachysurus vachellii]|uniref:formin isoform X1 n=1 Tax=Tachysurus vachellii TaxID=175792 RepID=UPI00296AD2B0|nr:formin isoform X1 [Tachysurus vachellii]
MDNHPANSFFTNFTNFFNHVEKTEDTPVLSSFRHLSEKNTELQNISVQKPHTIRFDDDSPVEQDLKAMMVSNQINSRTTSEIKVLIETDVLPRDEGNNHKNLDETLSLEQIMDNNVETHINTSMDRDEIKIQETPSHTGKEFMVMDLPVSMDQGKSWNNSSLTCQGNKKLTDGQPDLLSEAFVQEYNDACLSNTASAESQISGDPSESITEQIIEGLPDKVMRDGNTSKITKEEVLSTAEYEGKYQEWTNEVEHMQTSGTQKPSCKTENEELCPDSTFKTSSTYINNPISAVAFSDQADGTVSTFKCNLVKPDGDFGTKGKQTDTGNNKILPKEEFRSFLILDTYNGCHVASDPVQKLKTHSQSCSETGDTFLNIESDQVLLKLEPTSPDSLSEIQKGREIEYVQESSKVEIKQSGGQDRWTIMTDESDNLVQIEGEDKERNSESSGNPTPTWNQEEPLNNKNASRQAKIVTFSPGLKLEKPPQLPSIFSGLKGLKKDVQDQQKKTLTLEQPMMKRVSVKRALFSERPSKSETKGSILEQLSQLLSFDAGKVGAKKTQEPTASPPLSPSSEVLEEEMSPVEESVEGPDVVSSEENSKLTNTETTLNAFKAFFSPKPAKRNTSDHIDLDAVKRAFNPETIRAIFDRNSSKPPDNKNISENKSPENEERTPGRLQAVWPPPKSKDEEEKIGLKYTEAEHQAALLHLKRECKEEQEALEANFKLQLYHLRDENEETVSRLQAVIADLKSAANCSHRELRDAAVSTEDYFTPRIFRTVCIQTDRETFIKPVKAPEISKDLCPQTNVPKKLDLASIASNLSSKPEHAAPQLLPLPTPLPLSVQSGLDSVTTSNPLSLPGPSESYSKPAQTDKCPPLRQVSCLPPPPPPPPIILAGLAPPPPLLGPVPTPPSGSGLFSRAEERLQRKPRVEPVCPMKPLYWTRIQIQDSRNDTLWSMLKEPGIINTNEFAELFAKMASPAKRKPLSEAYDNTAKAKKIIKVLDSKRSQAVGILISSLHLEMKDIQQAILMMDNSVVDLDAIEALYETRAQPEELEKIRKHYETSDEEHVRLLDKPEQFLYELSLVPQFSLRAPCIILQSTFTDAVASIQRKANTVLHVCKGLLERDSVRDVLGLVLACGNYMNGGSRHRGQADGFGLDILPKLKDVKSRDNNTSLMDYIVSYYLHNLDENAGTENCAFPLPEPQDVFLASQVKFEDLSKELRKLGEDLEGCEKDVQSVWLTSPQEYIYPFKEKMETFILSAQNEKIATEHHLISAQKCFRDLVQYFGMKPRSGEQDVLPGHVFMLWFEFCNDFKTRWKKENKAISNERLKEAQQLVRNLTADKKVETRQVHANGLKERLRLKEASLSST